MVTWAVASKRTVHIKLEAKREEINVNEGTTKQKVDVKNKGKKDEKKALIMGGMDIRTRQGERKTGERETGGRERQGGERDRGERETGGRERQGGERDRGERETGGRERQGERETGRERETGGEGRREGD